MDFAINGSACVSVNGPKRGVGTTGVAVVRVTSRSTRIDAHRFYENNGYRLTKVSQIFEKKRPA